MHIPNFIPAKTRRHYAPRSETDASPAPVGLTVSSVVVDYFDGGAGVLTVSFAMPSGATLNEPVDADPNKWTVRYNGTQYAATALTFDGGNSIGMQFADQGSDVGPNVIDYAADPSDISDSLGQMLAAFENFPI